MDWLPLVPWLFVCLNEFECGHYPIPLLCQSDLLVYIKLFCFNSNQIRWNVYIKFFRFNSNQICWNLQESFCQTIKKLCSLLLWISYLVIYNGLPLLFPQLSLKQDNSFLSDLLDYIKLFHFNSNKMYWNALYSANGLQLSRNKVT